MNIYCYLKTQTQKERHIHRMTKRDRQRYRQTEIQTDIQTEIQTDRDTEHLSWDVLYPLIILVVYYSKLDHCTHQVKTVCLYVCVQYYHKTVITQSTVNGATSVVPNRWSADRCTGNFKNYKESCGIIKS